MKHTRICAFIRSSNDTYTGPISTVLFAALNVHKPTNNGGGGIYIHEGTKLCIDASELTATKQQDLEERFVLMLLLMFISMVHYYLTTKQQSAELLERKEAQQYLYPAQAI
ncbi:MAG: hypothetical protein LBD16_07555 [Oscillospiraceae bacterium]|nr:hypothetical protein [Oscillospiraceae bacterium]